MHSLPDPIHKNVSVTFESHTHTHTHTHTQGSALNERHECPVCLLRAVAAAVLVLVLVPCAAN